MKVGDWEPRKRIEREFVRAMQRALAALIPNVQTLLDPSLLVMQQQAAYDKAVEAAVMRMITQLFADNNRTWRAAAKEGSRGDEIYRALRQEFSGAKGQRMDELVRRRFWHIAQHSMNEAERIPVTLTNRALSYVQQETMRGRSPLAIERELHQMLPSMSNRGVKMFARTAISASQTAVTLARMDDLEQQWYVWRTCSDQRVRNSHREMDGVLVWIRDPPSPEKLIGKPFQGVYHAGQIWNCRCYPEPVLDLNYLTWPHKVHFRGKIKMMSRKEFEGRFGQIG